ncbi:hypothetical protein DPMN_162320 [Dreissena polymorpha]|uniref:Uncharacterized protein n=1 Tax=Dreissena polymorpha TaxID=45954 RepID=A0A9D4ERA1_DREPO|nr:hypothetical protein DPMN_162320 [Dreissena polymorpha]
MAPVSPQSSTTPPLTPSSSNFDLRPQRVSIIEKFRPAKNYEHIEFSHINLSNCNVSVE